MLLENKDIYLEVYPKMQIYDFIQVHLFFEERGYILKEKEKDLLWRLPIEPSFCFLNTVYKKTTLFQKLKKKIQMKVLLNLVNSESDLKNMLSRVQDTDSFKIIEFILRG